MNTVLHRLSEWADSNPQAPAQRYKEGGAWKTITAGEFRDRVYHLALFLESRGFTEKDVSCIFSANNPPWVHLDLAALLLGGKSAGIYPNSNLKDIHYVLSHTEAKVLTVQNREYYQRIGAPGAKIELPKAVQLLLVIEGDAAFAPQAMTYAQALAEGRKLAATKGAKKLQDYLGRIDPDRGAFMIYTSGTTGNPKGALLSHDNLVFTSEIAARYWGLPKARGSMFSFLPLCHVAEKIQNVGVGIVQNFTVNFCTKFENVSVELPEVQPSLLLSVPRLWEKMMEGVLYKVDHAPMPRKRLAQWALQVGARVAEAKYSGRAASLADQIQYRLADRLVLGKVRLAMGLGQAEILASGAAALPAHVSRWFRSLGLEILEDYGQTESTGVICMTQKGVDCAGTVGKPVPGLEVKLASDGEILTRGRHVFKCYYKDDAATAQTLEGGWLHTGDLGEFDARGLMRIRGRKKEIMKTSGGKMVAPLPIEETLKAAPVISQACMVGDGRKYLSVLVTLSEGKLAELQKRNGALSGPIVTEPAVVAEVKKHVDELNRSLASYEQIKKFAILPREFSIADGEMTPTLKMKRSVIESRYKDIIDQFYSRE